MAITLEELKKRRREYENSTQGKIDAYVSQNQKKKDKKWYEEYINLDRIKKIDSFKDYQKFQTATSNDILGNAFQGVFQGAEGLSDFARNRYADLADKYAKGADFIGWDTAANKLTKSATKARENALVNDTQDMIDSWEHIISGDLAGKKKTEDLTAYENIHKNSALGDSGREMTQSIALNMTNAALNTASGGSLGIPLIAASAAGNAEQEALQNGATIDEARTYGILMGGIEAGTEMLAGGMGKISEGIGFGKGALDDQVIKAINKSLKNTALDKTFIKNLASFGIKSVGEGLEEVAAGLGGAIAQKLTYMKDEDLTKLIKDQDLLKSFVMGTLSSVVMQAPSTVTSTVQGRDVNTGLTQAQQEYVNEIAEQRLVEAQKRNNKLNGYQQMKLEERTLEDYQKGRLFDSSKLPMSDDVKKMDLQQSAYKYGINPNSEAVVNIKTMTENRGINARFDETLTTQNAAWSRKGSNREILINPNADINMVLEEIAVHELTHDLMSSSNSNQEISRQNVLDYVSSLDNYEQLKKDYTNRYKEQIKGMSKAKAEAYINEEILADTLGKNIGSQEYIRKLVDSEPKFSKMLYNAVVDIANSLANKKGVKHEKLYWENVKNSFEDAYNMEWVGKGKKSDTKYLIGGIESVENLKRSQDIKDKKLAASLEKYYNKAIDLEKQGFSNEEIMKRTRWFKDKNNTWKYEFSDSEMNLKEDLDDVKIGRKYTINELFNHDMLTALYPGLNKYRIIFEKMGKKINGTHNIEEKLIRINSNALDYNNLSSRDSSIAKYLKMNNYEYSKTKIEGTLLHELQHAIQEIEKFETGNSSAIFRKAYYESLGEIEANDTKMRYILEKAGMLDRAKTKPESAKTNPTHKDLFNRSNLEYYLNKRSEIRKKLDDLYDKYPTQIDKIMEKAYNLFNKEGLSNEEIDLLVKEYQKEVEEKDSKNDLQNILRRRPTVEGTSDSSFSVEENNKGYHYGDLGKGRDTNFFSMRSSRRSTGHFGHGTYFLGNKENVKSSTKGDRPLQTVNFNDYKLLKPLIENEAWRLHDGLKAINNEDYDNFDIEIMKDNFRIHHGVSEETFNKALEQTKEYSKLMDSKNYEEQLEADSPSTVFMKALGYEGIDVRGLDGLDNTSYGSVIYDLKKNISLSEQLENQFSNLLEEDMQTTNAMLDNFKSYLEEYDITNPTQEDIDNSLIDLLGYDNDMTPAETLKYEKQYKEVVNEYLKEQNQDIRYSLTDNQGRELTKEQQEYFKDSKVKDEDGNLLAVYHGTPKGGFTIFDRNKTSRTELKSQFGTGFYFTNDSRSASDYNYDEDIYGNSATGENPKTYEVYLDIENPLMLNYKNMTEHNLDRNKIKELLLRGDNDYFFDNYISFITQTPDALNYKVDGLSREEINNLSKEDRVDYWLRGTYDLKNFGDKNFLQTMHRAYKNNSDLLDNFQDIFGYDGIIMQGAGKINQYIAFNSNQIKNVDNTNPTEDSDIRYSLSEDAFIKFTDNSLDNKKIAIDQLSPAIELGKIKTNKGEVLKLTSQEYNSGYGIYRKIVAKKENGEQAVLTFRKIGTNTDEYDYKNDEYIKKYHTYEIRHLEGAEPGDNSGTTLLNELIKEAKENGISKIVAYDTTHNLDGRPSKTYWEKQGFVSNGEGDHVLEIKDADIRYSLSDVDSELDPLTDAQREYFKNTVVKDQDNELEVVYHGTPNMFTVFDINKSDLGQYGIGWYFTNAKGTAEAFTGDNENILEGYLNIENPASTKEKTIAFSDFKRLYNELSNNQSYVDEDGFSIIDDVLSNYGDVNSEGVDKVLRNFYDMQNTDSDLIDNLAYKTNKKEILYDTVRKVTGIDGVVIENPTGFDAFEKYYIAFNPNQFKNKDNLKPTDNPDIRYARQDFNVESFYNKNFNPKGTKTRLGDIKLPGLQNAVQDEVVTQTQQVLLPIANELKELNNNIKKVLNPNEISQLRPQDANTTPLLPGINRNKVGDGKSKFFDNINNKVNMLSDEQKTPILNEEDVKYYDKVTNKDSLDEAFARLQENGASESLRWFNNKSENATATDVAEGWILLKQYADSGNTEGMVEVAKKMREIGTKAGQTVQAFNILSRLTPEGMVKYAQSELMEAYDQMVKNKTTKWIEENRGKFELQPNEVQFIMDTMKEVSTMRDGYDKKFKLAQIQKLMTDKLPPAKGAGIKAWMRISMLFNPKTQVRNVAGNALIAPINAFGDLFASGADKLISKKTGVRTTGNFNLKTYSKGMKKGLYESYNDFKHGVNTRNIQGNRFELTEGKSFKDTNAIGKALNRVDGILSFMLDAGDRGFYEASFVNSINNQLVLNNTTEVTDTMIDIATQEALSRTWQDNNKYTKFVLSIRNQLNQIGIGGYGLGDILIPFAKTPANLTKAIIDYSPVGLVNTINKGIQLNRSLSNGQYNAQLQHEFVQNLGKTVAGTMLYVAGLALAKAGVTTGESDEDKDTANFLKNTLGVNSYSIQIGDMSFTYDWAQPLAAPLAITANLVNKQKEEASLLENITSTLDTAGNILLDQSFMESISTVLNNQEGIATGIQEAILDLPSRAVPTLFKQIVDITDGTQRQTFVKGKPIQSAVNSVIAKIPGLSYTLDASVDTLGRDIEKYGGKNNLFNVFLNPANVNTENISESAQEIYDVYKQTGESSVMPRVAPYTITIDGEKINLSTADRTEYQRISGKIIEDNVQNLMNTSAYTNMSDTKKAEVISNIVNYSYNVAQKELFGKELSDTYEKAYGYSQIGDVSDYYTFKESIDDTNADTKRISIRDYLVNSYLNDEQLAYLYGNYYSSENELKYVRNAKISMKEFIKFDSEEFTSDYNSKGNAITNSRRNKMINFVNGLNLSLAQKAMLIKTEYSSYDRYDSQIFNYVNGLQDTAYNKMVLLKKAGFDDYDNEIIEHVNSQNISKAEKEKILKDMGFKVRNGRVYS